MDKKYVIIGGLAFSEESDMKKLKSYAKKGWLLEDIVAGFFYKLRKDKSVDIDYNVDYQLEADSEYFNLFSEAGWEKVVSVDNEIHIFSAPEGTKPIYTDRESIIDKYDRMKNKMGQWAAYFFSALVILALALVGSSIYLRPVFLIVLLLFIINIFLLVFTFMPYIAFCYRVKKLKKHR